MSEKEERNDGNPPFPGEDEKPGRKPGGQGPEKKKPFRLSFGWILLFVLAAILLSQLLAPGAKNPSWSQLTEWAKKKELKDVVVTKNQIAGKHLVKEKGENGKPQYESFNFPRVTTENDVQTLQKLGVSYTTRQESDFSSLIIWFVIFLLIIGVFLFMMRRMNPSQQVMSFGKSKAKIYAEKEVGIDFSDVAGIDEAVDEVKEIVDFLKDPGKFQALGARIPKGVLLLGAPGTGKTLLARAVAGEAKVPFYSLSGSDFVEMFVGVGASRVRDLFRQAVQNSPCIVFIDELDALGKTRGATPVSNDEREQTLNALLVEMDGFDPNSGVIIMAATNRPEILDPALMRPGRFDRQIVVDKPDIRGREAILEVHAKKVKLNPDVDLSIIAARTPGFAGADLANVINEAALLAARRGKRTVTMSELEEAIDRTIAGLEKKQRLMTDKEKEIVAYHETGHALVASLLPNTDPVHRISIIPRGMGSLGHTLQLPTDERFLLTLEELKSRMAVILGGRAAEKVVYGQVSTGAHDDLERASKMARRMVTEYGMSDRMGAVSWEQERRSYLWSEGMGTAKDYSEETGREIDEEVQKVVGEAESLAVHTLEESRDMLEKVARRLMEVELIDREELEELLGRKLAVDGKSARASKASYPCPTEKRRRGDER